MSKNRRSTRGKGRRITKRQPLLPVRRCPCGLCNSTLKDSSTRLDAPELTEAELRAANAEIAKKMEG